MLHKTIKVKTQDRRVIRVRLHSLDGKTWLASSPRHAVREYCAFTARRADTYAQARANLITLDLPE